MKCAHPGSICNGTREFGKNGFKELLAAHIRYAAVFFFVRRIHVAATALCDLNDGMIVFARDLGHEVVDTAGPNFQSRLRERTFRCHHRMEACIWIASAVWIPGV